MSGKVFIDFIVPWYRLGLFGFRIMIPVVLCPVTNKNTTHVIELSDKVFSFHATSSSPFFLTLGSSPEVRSE